MRRSAGLTLNAERQLQLRSSNAAYQHLARARPPDVVANYTVTDEHGAPSTATLTITVTGTNDAPVAVADTNSRQRRQRTITGTVATNDSDVDDGASLSYSLDAPVGGADAQRRRQLQLRSGNAAYQHLAAGATTRRGGQLHRDRRARRHEHAAP